MEFIEQINTAGIENCMFLIPMKPVTKFMGMIAYTSSSDPDIIVPAKISEARYKLKEQYKITLESIYEQFGKQHFYISDLVHLIADGTIEFFIRNK
jgi:hypothetical protein